MPPALPTTKMTLRTVAAVAGVAVLGIFSAAVVNTVIARRAKPEKEEDAATSALQAELNAHFTDKAGEIAEILSKAIQLRTVSFENSDGKPASLVGQTHEKAAAKCSCGLHEEKSEAVDSRAVATEDALNDCREAFIGFHELLAASFPLLHSTLEKHVVNTFSLVFVWKPADGTPPAPGIGLAAHMDVVPAADAADWANPPFSGIVKDGFVHGRGAIDDKQAVVSICAAVEKLISLGFKPKKPVVLMFGHDEEIGGYDGASSIAAELPSILSGLVPSDGKPLEVILDEGLFLLSNFIPGLKARVAAVCIAEKGAANIEVVVRQPAGHSSVPRGPSSISILAEAITRITNHKFPVHFNIISQFFAPLIPFLPPIPALLFSNFWLFKPLLARLMLKNPVMAANLKTTTAVTIVSGGYKSNVLPPEAKVVVNHRIHPGDSVEGVLETYADLTKDLAGASVLPFSTLDPSPISSTESLGFKAVGNTVQSVFSGPIAIAPSLMMANTDTRWYWNLSDTILRHCPTELSIEETGMFHGKNEKISVGCLARLAAFFGGVVVRTARG